MGSRGEAQRRFLKGVIVLNAVLAPIAAAGLYLAYLGKHGGSTSLLVVGIALTIVSPLLAYAIAAPLAERLSGGHSGGGGRGNHY